MGGPPGDGSYGRREQSAVLCAGQDEPLGSVGLQRVTRAQTGISIPSNVMYNMLLDEGMSERQQKKSRRRKRMRYERKHSDSLWHTDWKQLDDGRWFPCCGDDASRFVTRGDAFESPTAGNALAVLDAAIRDHGRPVSIMTDHGSQFCANEKEGDKRGASEFEKWLADLGHPADPGRRAASADKRQA